MFLVLRKRGKKDSHRKTAAKQPAAEVPGLAEALVVVTPKKAAVAAKSIVTPKAKSPKAQNPKVKSPNAKSLENPEKRQGGEKTYKSPPAHRCYNLAYKRALKQFLDGNVPEDKARLRAQGVTRQVKADMIAAGGE